MYYRIIYHKEAEIQKYEGKKENKKPLIRVITYLEKFAPRTPICIVKLKLS